MFYFLLIFILNEPFRSEEIDVISYFKSSELGFRIKKVVLQILVDILPFGSGSVDPHIFADPDSDPDPKPCFKL